jgi:RNA polymerase sigma-54 factor
MQKINTNLNLRLKTQQALILTLGMQQALHILQLPVTELAGWLQCQIEQNPALQFDESPSDDDFSELNLEADGFEILNHLDETFVQSVFPDESIPEEKQISAPSSLHDHLMAQARVVLTDPEMLHKAEEIIGHLDSRGFIGDCFPDMDILKIVQTFDPPGIAARNLRESLLIQLELLGKKTTLAYQIIENHFEAIMKGKLSYVAQQIQSTPSRLTALLKHEISSLNFHPGSQFRSDPSPSIIPDIFVEQMGKNWNIKINETFLPRFTIAAPSPEISNFYSEAKWIQTILERRGEILRKITSYLLEKHASFFQGTTTNIEPFTLQEMSQKLNLNESTIGRAVKDKYLSCPQGIFSLKHFFPHSATKGTETSHLDAKKLLKHLIDQEDKKHPLSDLTLAQAMAEAGIPCARRTIAKYRKSLKIPTASLRKGYFSF